MRRRPLTLLLAPLVGAALLAAPAATAAPPGPPDVYRPVRGPAAPAEYRYLQKTLPGQSIPRHAHENAAAQARRLPAVGGRWKPLGPTNIGGRIVSLALDPRRAETPCTPPPPVAVSGAARMPGRRSPPCGPTA
ncbi:hypothetical protein [Streptomyces sp. WAC05374]|uniref:hypothetical protein n=1 Tax=Streptomyces sp. WAC05374 TaxID=2487420 RepID=UPI001F2DDFB3|nr:hypothetical protein [Streptomyces sp. WAC05374]